MNFNLKENTRKVIKQSRRKFSSNEDELLKTLVKKYGTNNWQAISNEMKGRNQRECRGRWFNYLSSNFSISEKDDELLKEIKMSKILKHNNCKQILTCMNANLHQIEMLFGEDNQDIEFK